MKRELVKEILLLKSAFSVIDQMFNQEISNAEVLRNRWFWGCLYKYDKLPEPLGLNIFIGELMDPFHDPPEDSKEQLKEKIRAHLEKAQKALEKKGEKGEKGEKEKGEKGEKEKEKGEPQRPGSTRSITSNNSDLGGGGRRRSMSLHADELV